ncbi:probable ATP-dependent RNA helicase DDX28 isoform X2 [Orussus abietinus]|uniref:probable ATP-dependent RNA helicase DDX28 isoform X2 n=1 Tax=Orussus abietinus TaxID=222816 RepID=UPI0006264A07|nr:probable ATP-dependent RNA helicase DDX28 isoform X2 [Orussus abietinus]
MVSQKIQGRSLYYISYKKFEIQERAIPMILSGENVIIAAHTGCGKTLAYLLPLLHQILKWKDITDRHFNSPLGLIITPSKELAAQIAKVVIALTQDIDFNVKTIVGGQTKHLLMSKPIENVDLIIASLGTINKLVRDGLYKMDHVRITVLDEADSLFDGTFQAKLRQVLRNITFGFKQEHLHNTLPVTAQLMLVSATMPTDLIETLHDIVNTDSLQTASTNRLHHVHVLQKFIRLMKPDKPTMLLKMVKQKYLNDCPLIIFSNETSTCDWISMYLNEFNIRNVNLNGQMNLKLRRGMFSQFQCGNVTVLSTTDAGSRGLDTVMARQVLNYDLPTSTVDYIHRCGRIGRLGSPHDCKVTSFVARPLEIVLVQKIERAIRKKVPIPLCDVLKDANESDKIDSKYDQELQDMLDNIPDPKTSQYSEEYPTPY